MRLTVVPADKAVYVDGVTYYNPLEWEGTPPNVHALQWFDSYGWIEFTNGDSNEIINTLPAWALNAYQAWVEATTPKPPPIPTPEENKYTASQLLAETDWAAIPALSDPTKSNPYLGNANEYDVYRNMVRQYVINPVGGNVEWPVKPHAVWRGA